MKRAFKTKLSAGLVLCFGLLVSVIGSSAPLQNPNPPQNPTEKSATLIVKLKQGMSEAARQATVQRHGGTRKHSFSQLDLEVVEMPEGKVAAFIKNAKDDPDLVRVEVNHTRKLQSLPSDTLIADQWALPKIGWDQVYGSVFPSSTAEVAILDTGIDPTHPDLVGAIAPGASMIDDSAGMTDPNGHGTWLAGIVAGRTDNAVGIAGVAYSQVRVQPVKVLDANGEGQDSDIINGVLWATDHGASVILMAFSDTGFSPALQDAIDYAWSRGVVLVAAAGNDASNVATFPAGDKGVIGVSATDPNDELSVTSNYGPSVFLAAPGVSIESTYLNSGYVTFSGTSASAAIVAGTAAMMRAIDPTLANGVVVSRIARTADPAGTLEQTGNGRVNMARAIADSSIDEIEPLGAPPVGGAGPFVGPYRAAASNLTSVTVASQSGVLTYGTSGSVNYTVTVTRSGNGNLDVTLSTATSLPAGTTSSFSPSVVSFSGGTPTSRTSTLTITTVSTTPAGSNAFTVTASGGGDTKTGPGSLVIAAKPVTGSFTVSSKTYDGNTSGAVLTRSLSGVFASDASNVSLTGGTAAFVDASVANAKTVTLTGATLTGTAAGNYSLTSVNPATANITALGIIGKFTASNKTFDATNSASVLTRSLQGVLSGDVSNVSLNGGTATFADSSVGTGKVVTLAGAILSGTASANYNLTSVNTTTADITKANATISVTPYSLTYDSTSHTATGTASGVAGANLSGQLTLTGTTHTNAGDYPADAWSFAGGTNYNDANGAVHNIIDKANATIVVTPYHVTYDANALTAAGTATGIAGVDLSANLTLTATTHTNAGDYPADAWSFAGGTNYNDANGAVHNIIDKANATIVVTPYHVTYDANAHTAAGTATGVAGVNLGASLTLTGTTHTNAGDYPADVWNFAGGTNYNDANGTVHNIIDKANATIVVTPYHVTYEANAHTAAGTATGVAGVDLSASLTLTATTHTNAGDYPADVWSFAGGTNYNDANGTTHDLIDKANATIVVTPYHVTYEANAHTAAGTATGVAGVDLSASLTLTGTTHTNAGDYPADVWSFAGGINYNDANGTTHDLIDKANAVVNLTGFTGIYDATSHGASATIAGVTGDSLAAGSSFNRGSSFTNVPGGFANWTFTGGSNYNDQSGTVEIVISKATAAVAVTGYHVSYDGNGHTATGTATGAGGADLSASLVLSATAHTNSGNYSSDGWSFAGGTNYNDANGTVHDIIDRSNATIVVTPYHVNYDGSAHTATGTANGVQGETLSGLDLSGTSHTNAGSYSADSWTFTDVTGNYFNASGTTSDSIARIHATITVNGFNGPYDASAHGASGTATGASSENLNSQLQLGATFTNGPGGNAHWVFAGGTNYLDESGDVAILINRIPVSINVIAYDGLYDGASHGASGTATGLGGINLGGLLHVGPATFMNVPGGTVAWTFDGDSNYNADGGSVDVKIAKSHATIAIQGFNGSYDGAAHGAIGTVSGAGGENLIGQLNAGASFTNVPGGTAHWVFTGGINYIDESGDAAIVITRAASTTTTLGGGPFTYDVTSHAGGSGTVTGAGGLSTTATSLTYSGDQVNSGTYYVTAHYSGDANHEASDGAAIGIVIDRAASTTVTSGAGPFTYDGSTHTGGSGTVTGVGSLSTTATSLTYSGDQINSGTYYVTAHYSGDANHEASDGAAIGIVIDRAASITVTSGAGPFTYDGSTHTGGSGTVTGAGSLNTTATSLTYSGDQINAGSYTVTAHYAGDANHTSSDGAAVTIVINKAASTTTTIGGGPFTYDGSTHAGGSGSVTGAGGLSTSATSLTYSGDQVNAGSYNVTAYYAGDANHEASHGAAVITLINKATATINITPYSVTYDGAAHTATASATGVGGVDLSAGLNLSGTTHTTAGSYVDSWSFTGGANYSDATGTVSDIIAKANAQVTVNGYSGMYDGNLHGASGSAKGIGGANMNASLNLGGSFKEVPGGTAHWVFTGGTNYNDQTGDAAIVINKWTVSGFYQPVDMTPADSPTVWNTVKGGSTVPLKFNIYVGTTEQTSISAIKEFQIFDVMCSTSVIADIPLEVTTTGGTSLRYDTSAHQFIQNWQTPKAAGKCYVARMTALDGSTISNAFFKTK